MKHAIFLIVFLSSAALAECPSVSVDKSAFAEVLAEARAAPNETAGRIASEKMWKIWLRAPDTAAQEALDRGMRKRQVFDLLGAYEEFDRLVSYCPDYAEGYNQRAFVSFLREEFEAALIDLDKTLSLWPDHVGAQSGRALTLMNLGRLDEAREQMLAALNNNPWLSERALIAPGAPLGPSGEDI